MAKESHPGPILMALCEPVGLPEKPKLKSREGTNVSCSKYPQGRGMMQGSGGEGKHIPVFWFLSMRGKVLSSKELPPWVREALLRFTYSNSDHSNPGLRFLPHQHNAPLQHQHKPRNPPTALEKGAQSNQKVLKPPLHPQQNGGPAWTRAVPGPPATRAVPAFGKETQPGRILFFNTATEALQSDKIPASYSCGTQGMTLYRVLLAETSCWPLAPTSVGAQCHQQGEVLQASTAKLQDHPSPCCRTPATALPPQGIPHTWKSDFFQPSFSRGFRSSL